MIEEFMLLANMTVARRLIQHFPRGAMLRRHPLPKEDLKLVVSEWEGPGGGGACKGSVCKRWAFKLLAEQNLMM